MSDTGVTPRARRHSFRGRALRGLGLRAVVWTIGLIACIVGAIDNDFIYRWLFIIAAAQCLFQLAVVAYSLRRVYRDLHD